VGSGEGSSAGLSLGGADAVGLGTGDTGTGASADGVTSRSSKFGSGNGAGFWTPAIASSMKSFQIAAGIVPPNTSGTPSMFTSGICPLG
jgi:hypothetical protein